MSCRAFLPVLFATSASLMAEPAEPKFRAVTIDDRIQIGYGVAVSDVDGDRAPDILLVDKKQFVWYRNPGPAASGEGSAWKKFLLAENLTEKDNVCIAAADTDGDGKCEVAVGAQWNPADTVNSGAVFYLIPPEDRTQLWEPVKFPNVEPTTHRMRWFKAERAWGLVVVPLHGRGNRNGEGAPAKVLFYAKPNDPKAEWKSEVVDESQHMTHNFELDREGDPYLVIAGKEGCITVRRDPVGSWGRVGFVETPNAAGEARLGVRGEALFLATVEPMHGNTLSVYPDAISTEKVVLTDKLTEGHALATGDFLEQGSDQIVVGWRGNPAQPRPVGIKLFTAMDEKGAQWRETTVDDNGMACEDLQLADLNGDGKVDIVASGRSTRNVKIYFNETAK